MTRIRRLVSPGELSAGKDDESHSRDDQGSACKEEDQSKESTEQREMDEKLLCDGDKERNAKHHFGNLPPTLVRSICCHWDCLPSYAFRLALEAKPPNCWVQARGGQVTISQTRRAQPRCLQPVSGGLGLSECNSSVGARVVRTHPAISVESTHDVLSMIDDHRDMAFTRIEGGFTLTELLCHFSSH